MSSEFVQTTDNGTTAFQSPLLISRGVRHAFFTRLGGVSSVPFDSLNFGYGRTPDRPDGDDADHVAENRRRALGNWPALRSVWQVHGSRCVGWEEADATVQADAVVLEAGEGTAGVMTADCCPVLLADPTTGRVAAVHAGWRGTVGGVLEQTIQVVAARGSTLTDLVAAVGPCIGPEHFEVGEEVAAQFDPADVLRRPAWPRPHVDVPSAVERRLRAAGVTKVDLLRLCTYERSDLFFSHRRDNGRTGRMLNVIAA